MPRQGYWTPERVIKSAQAFIDVWKDDRSHVINLVNLNKAADVACPDRPAQFAFMGAASAITGMIEQIAQRDFQGELPLRVGRGGHIIRRSLTGAPSVLDKKEPTKTQVSWTDEEKEKIQKGILQRFKIKPAEGLTLEVLRRSMHEALPQDRWRTILTIQQVKDVWDAAELAIMELVEQASSEQKVIQTVVTVPVRANADWIVRNYPLPQLAAILAERQTKELLMSCRGNAIPTVPEVMAKEGISDKADLASTYPVIQVLGIRDTQNATLRDRFKNDPVRILDSITPDTPFPTNTRNVFENVDMVIVDTTTMPREWRDLVVEKKDVKQRQNVFGSGRIDPIIKEMCAEWRRNHPGFQ